MIQYLSFARPKLENKNGKINKDLPFGLRTIHELPSASYVSTVDKLRILMEQAVLGSLILDMNEGKSQTVKDYMLDLYKLARLSLPSQIDTMDSILYSKYKDTLFSFLEDFKSGKYDAIALLEDRINFSKEACVIPSDFYIPYLRTVSGRVGKGNNPDYTGAMLLVPHIENCKFISGQRIVFSSERFTNCKLSEDFNFMSVTPSMEYVLRLDWSGKSWIQFVDMTQSFCVNRSNIFESHQSLPGMMANILYRESHKNLISSKSRGQFIASLRYLYQTYRMELGSFESLRWVLSGLGYENLDLLTSSNPTKRELLGFEQYSDLEFIKQYKLQVAMEAAESEEEEEEEKPEEETEDDALEDDPETDPESDEADEGESTDEPTEETSDDDFGTDDMGGGDTSSGSDSGDGAKQTDTPSDPKDPFSIAFEITKSESMDEYFQREALTVMITSLINNPPETVSSETVAFLRVWVNQWINLVSVETTKSVLSQLAVTFDV